MKKLNFFRGFGMLSVVCLAILVFSSCQKEEFADLTENIISARTTPPTVPAELAIPAGYVVSQHSYAQGVQIYRCTETSPGVYAWVFVAPDASLYGNAGFTGKIGTHYAGPTWESNSGSKVIGYKIDGVVVDPTAVAWLKLGVVSSQGPGIYNGTAFIQRINTVGGLAPAVSANAGNVGQEIGVPYTAEYYFYKAE